MTEIIQWATLTPERRNCLVHEKVMGKSIKCSGHPITIVHRSPSRTQGEHFEYATWHCETCGKGASQIAPEEHDAPGEIPNYSESLDAAWQLVRRVNNPNNPAFPDYQDYANFIECLEELVGSNLFFDLFYCDAEGDHLNPERICIAALRAVGCEVQV
jgi:hypothetical protein